MATIFSLLSPPPLPLCCWAAASDYGSPSAGSMAMLQRRAQHKDDLTRRSGESESRIAVAIGLRSNIQCDASLLNPWIVHIYVLAITIKSNNDFSRLVVCLYGKLLAQQSGRFGCCPIGIIPAKINASAGETLFQFKLFHAGQRIF